MRKLLALLGICYKTGKKDGKYWYYYIRFNTKRVSVTFAFHHYRWFDITSLRTNKVRHMTWVKNHMEDLDIALGWVSIEYLRKYDEDLVIYG
jgi:hypothetical protein